MLKNLLRFYDLLKPYRGKVLFSVLIGSIAGAGTGGGITKGAEMLFSEIFSGDNSLSTSELWTIAAAFPVLFTIIGASTFASSYLLHDAGLGAIRDLRARCFNRLQALPLAYFQKAKTGDLISRITTDTQLLQVTLTYLARNLIVHPATLLFALGYLAHKAWGNQGVIEIYLCLAVLPVVIFPIRIFSRKLQRKAKLQQEGFGHLTDNVAQNLSAAREVRAFNLQANEQQRFHQRVTDLFLAQMKVIKYSYSLGPVVEIFSSIGLSIAFIIGYKNGIDGGVFFGIFLALYFTYTSVKKLGTFSGELYKGIAALDRINEVIVQPIEIEDPSNHIAIDKLRGAIEFRDVSFSYDKTSALKKVNARVEPGSTCALVGPSGAGKSTFANLVPRFYDVNDGQVLIDSIDIRSLRQHDLREQIALVSQDPILFDDTISENIRIGNLHASEEEIRTAAKNAFADDFILEQPDGYDTIVGERGTRLSGGQKQRIAIARAFLRNAPILILDEATSALDSESEQKIQKALDELVVGKTVLIIAHRFSTIKNADKIIVFQDGAIIDEGPHDQLYGRCDLYRKLYDQQVR